MYLLGAMALTANYFTKLNTNIFMMNLTAISQVILVGLYFMH